MKNCTGESPKAGRKYMPEGFYATGLKFHALLACLGILPEIRELTPAPMPHRMVSEHTSIH